MIKYLVIENGVLYGYSNDPTVNTIEYDFEQSNVSFEDFIQNPKLYKLTDGQLVLDENNIQDQLEQEIQRQLDELKSKRESLFRKYIDRSPMWYDERTQEELNELSAWRQTWLNMPIAFDNNTWVEPALPAWLD